MDKFWQWYRMENHHAYRWRITTQVCPNIKGLKIPSKWSGSESIVNYYFLLVLHVEKRIKKAICNFLASLASPQQKNPRHITIEFSGKLRWTEGHHTHLIRIYVGGIRWWVGSWCQLLTFFSAWNFCVVFLVYTSNRSSRILEVR